MKVTLESTSDHLILKTPDGSVPARRWQGTTESGIVVHAYVTRLFATSVDDTERLEREIEVERAPVDLAGNSRFPLRPINELDAFRVIVQVITQNHPQHTPSDDEPIPVKIEAKACCAVAFLGAKTGSEPRE